MQKRLETWHWLLLLYEKVVLFAVEKEILLQVITEQKGQQQVELFKTVVLVM